LGLVAGCQHSQPDEAVSKRAEALTPGPSFTLQLPPQITTGGSGVTASTTLSLGDRVQIKQPTGTAFAGVVNLGSGATTIGHDDKTGDVWSIGAVTLQDRAAVSGFLKTAGALTRGTGTTVSGTIQQNTPLTAPTLATVTVQFQNGAGAVTVANDATRTLTPGDYAAVNLGARSILALSTGDYRFDSLGTQPQSVLRVTTTSGPVRVFIRNTLNWNSTVTAAAGDPSKLLVGYVGATAITMNTPFIGTLLSPNAGVTLPTVSTPHAGAFFAKSMNVAPDVVITTEPFTVPCQGVNVDDGNACTTDSCDPNTGVVTHAPVSNGSACNDNNACTQSDTCQAGACVGANPVTCTAQDQCHTAGTCAPATGFCSNPAKTNGTACSDGNACTQSDTCQAGACVGANPVTCAAPDQCHAAGTCNTSTGVCSNPAKANGSTCSDGSACTQSDSCQNGACVGSSPVVCTALDQCHVAGACDPTSGACSNPAKSDGSACSDGNACTQSDSCQNGTCAGSNPVVCAALDQCHTAGSCDTSTGVCSNPTKTNGTACNDNNACTQTDQCQSGTCTGSNPVVCAALDQCHVAGTCDTSSGTCSNPTKTDGAACSDNSVCTAGDVCTAGTCQPGNAVATDDNNPCTADSCDPVTGVKHTPVAAGTSCSDGNACNGAETCNVSGVCVNGTPLVVDDGNPCTFDACDPAAGVQHTPAETGTSCEDGNACNGAEFCDGNAHCQPGTPLSTDDGNPCTADSCDPSSGVKHVPVSNGTACDDANVCNGHETCQVGTCAPGAPLTTDDGNPCTVDSCDPVAGVSHAPVATGTACDNATVCDGHETCNAAGSCVAGAPATSDDNNPCTTDSCDPVAGVQHAPTNAGTSCADQNVCNGVETCDGQGTCAPGTPAVTDDGNPCTADSCDPIAGVKHSPVAQGTSCADGNLCDGDETCNATGQCVSGTPAAVDDNNPCTADSCDPATGIVHTPAPTGTACDDGNPCNGLEQCNGLGQCTSSGITTVDDLNPCTVDACDPANGVTHTPVAAGISCADSDICNGDERCDAVGHCMAGTPVNVDDNDPCTLDECDPIDGAVHAEIPGCRGGVPGQQFETRVSIMGHVIHLDGSAVTNFTVSVFNDTLDSLPRADSATTIDGDGTFRVRLLSFPESVPDRTPPQHVFVKLESPDFPSIYRSAYVNPSDVVALGNIVVLQRDPAVTVVGSEGGTAQSSDGSLQLIVPQGALSQPTPIRLTPIHTRAEFPLPLPHNSLTTYGMELEPSGTTFAIPAILRVQNTLNIPTDMKIPVGAMDPHFGDWQPNGQAVWDGSRFTAQVTHFSPWDCNFFGAGELIATIDHQRDKDKSKGQDCGTGSSLSYANGSLQQSIPLPMHAASGHDYSLRLNYDSGQSGSLSFGKSASSSPSPQLASGMTISPAGVSVHVECVPPGGAAAAGCGGGGPPCVFGGTVGTAFDVVNHSRLFNQDASDSAHLNASAAQYQLDFNYQLPNDPSGAPPRGGYFPNPISALVTVGGAKACVVGGAGFGTGSPAPTTSGEPAPGTTARLPLEPGELLDFPDYQLVVHRRGSPLGSGWALEDLGTLYRAPDHMSADIMWGNAQRETFRPYPTVRRVADLGNTGAGCLGIDRQTSEVFTAWAQNPNIMRLDPNTGAVTSVAPSPTSQPQNLVVTYVNGQRVFLVSTTRALFEVHEDGTTRQIFAFATGPANVRPAVTGVGHFAYASGDRLSSGADSQALVRVDLADPARPVTTISSTSGSGDLSLDPHGQVKAQDFWFIHPRGVAPAFDGGLYVADDRRHAVYHLAANENGEVGPSSLVTRVLGSGIDTMTVGLGRKLPALEMSIHGPEWMTAAPDGTIYITSTSVGGALAFDPVEQTAHWVAFDSNSVLHNIQVNLETGSLAALGGDQLLSASVFDTSIYLIQAPFTSEFEPTRSITFDANGATVVDATADKTEQYQWLTPAANEGHLVSEALRSGEPIRTVAYKDADRIDYIQDAAGGRVRFDYDGAGHLSHLTDPANRSTSFTVDVDGNLREVRYPTNEAWRFEYQDFRMLTATHPNSEVSTYTYAADGTLSSSTRPGGGVTQIQSAMSGGPQYDANGRLFYQAELTDDRGVQHAIQVDAAGAVASDNFIADGQTYDVESMYATTLVGPSGLENTGNRLLRIAGTTVNGLNVTPLATFNPAGQLVKLQKVVGGQPLASTVMAPTYDAAQRLSKIDWAINFVDWGYTYDAAGHLTKAADLFIGGTDETGRRTTFDGFRPSDGQPTSITQHGVTTTLGYDAFGLVNSSSDTAGRTLSVTHDAAGNTRVVNDGTTTVQFDYDDASRLKTITDLENNVTQLDYRSAGCGCSNGDRIGAITTPDLPAGEKWTFDYDPDGDLQLVTTPLGEQEQFFHNPQRDVIAAVDRLNRSTTFTYDQLGRKSTITDTAGRVGTFAYSVPSASSWSGPTLYAQSANDTPPPTSLTASLADGQYQVGINGIQPYDFKSHIDLYRDATFQFAFWSASDLLDRVVATEDRSTLAIDSTDPGPTSGAPITDTGFSYSNNVSLNSSPFPLLQGLGSSDPIIPGKIWSAALNRNADFDITSVSGFLGTPSAGAAGILSLAVGRDTAGRITSVTATPTSSQGFSSSSTFSYKPNGQLDEVAQTVPGYVRVNDGGACFCSSQCGLRDCSQESDDCTSKNGTLTEGHCGVIHDTVGTTTEHFGYDDRGLVQTRLVSMGTLVYSYDAVGRNTLLAYPDGHTRRQTFDALGRLTSRCYSYNDGSPERCYTAQYDAVGSPTVLTDPDMRQEVDYDALDRVTRVRRYAPPDATAPAYIETYAYNALGSFSIYDGVVMDDQRPRLDGNGKASAGIPETLAGQPVTLDAGGRVSSFSGNTFQYFRYDHRLQSFLSAGQSQTYVYDALGRLQQIHVGPTDGSLPTTDHLYFYTGLDNTFTAIADSVVNKPTFAPQPAPDPPDPRTLYQVIYDGIDQPLAANNAYYYELDTTGNVRRLHGDALAPPSSAHGDFGGYSYTAFGKRIAASDPGGVTAPAAQFEQPFTWQGKREIAANLYDSRARIWSADLGAFLQPDQYVYLVRGGTLWSWPGNNPLKNRDPSGRNPLIGAVIGGVAGALYYAGTVSTATSWSDFGEGLAAATAGGAVAGAAISVAAPVIAEGALVAGGSIIFGGGALGDTIANSGAGGSFDPYRALTAGTLNVAGAGLGEALAEPLTPYAESLVASSGVKEELAKAVNQGQVRAAIGSLLYGFPSGYLTDWLNQKPQKPGSPDPCPTNKR
jgi:RHS repeat-associated protein